MNILVFDDVLDQLNELGKNLTNRGHFVKLYNNSDDFIKEYEGDKISLGDYQLAIIDQNMDGGGLSGFEIGKYIKSINPKIAMTILTGHATFEQAIEAIKLGFDDYFQKPTTTVVVDNILLKAESWISNLKNKYFTFSDNFISNSEYLIVYDGSCLEMNTALQLMRQILNYDITVLLCGESGTGKELFAKTIHYSGLRKDGPFVVINCASIPRDLIESELFGHERGAFTSANNRRIGKFEQANEGTIFLDEIGELELSLQAKILRVLQEKEFERIGGNDVIKTNVRIIAATNKDLKTAVNNGEFREDLYYRLNRFTINLPSLRSRISELPTLVQYFITKYNIKYNKSIRECSKEVMNIFKSYDWPGNIRELENTIERCIILSSSDIIEIGAIQKDIIDNINTTATVDLFCPIKGDDLIDFLNAIEQALNNYDKSPESVRITEIAKDIGCSHANIIKRFKNNKNKIISLSKPEYWILLKRTHLWKTYIS